MALNKYLPCARVQMLYHSMHVHSIEMRAPLNKGGPLKLIIEAKYSLNGTFLVAREEILRVFTVKVIEKPMREVANKSRFIEIEGSAADLRAKVGLLFQNNMISPPVKDSLFDFMINHA